jgi:hypothetical protein
VDRISDDHISDDRLSDGRDSKAQGLGSISQAPRPPPAVDDDGLVDVDAVEVVGALPVIVRVYALRCASRR